ncbi:SMP-30/gluconolactonase/LRE family protein [Mesorhizobium sp.]|uniref:SMP-30/gluconolactonase/LRE family protein n=1 Tax=Mesorhizobium sp. TaxID=1871066 RepID=UPI0025D4AC70|nr:SMP-30/gluconolactonase/LRE family protein [Mesorhizobium sp.]
MADCPAGIFDGLRLDDADNISISTDDGVYCYKTGGTVLGKIKFGKIVTNPTFAGPRRNTMYICATNRLYPVENQRPRQVDPKWWTRH